jgi:hypothetical protein
MLRPFATGREQPAAPEGAGATAVAEAAEDEKPKFEALAGISPESLSKKSRSERVSRMNTSSHLSPSRSLFDPRQRFCARKGW